jgi:hypothetical protein
MSNPIDALREEHGCPGLFMNLIRYALYVDQVTSIAFQQDVSLARPVVGLAVYLRDLSLFAARTSFFFSHEACS